MSRPLEAGGAHADVAADADRRRARRIVQGIARAFAGGSPSVEAQLALWRATGAAASRPVIAEEIARARLPEIVAEQGRHELVEHMRRCGVVRARDAEDAGIDPEGARRAEAIARDLGWGPQRWGERDREDAIAEALSRALETNEPGPSALWALRRAAFESRAWPALRAALAGRSLLERAAELGDAGAVQLLMEAGAYAVGEPGRRRLAMEALLSRGAPADGPRAAWPEYFAPSRALLSSPPPPAAAALGPDVATARILVEMRRVPAP